MCAFFHIVSFIVLPVSSQVVHVDDGLARLLRLRGVSSDDSADSAGSSDGTGSSVEVASGDGFGCSIEGIAVGESSSIADGASGCGDGCDIGATGAESLGIGSCSVMSVNVIVEGAFAISRKKNPETYRYAHEEFFR